MSDFATLSLVDKGQHYNITRTKKEYFCTEGGDMEDIEVSGPDGTVSIQCYHDKGFLAVMPVPDSTLLQTYSASFRNHRGMSRSEILSTYKVVVEAMKKTKQKEQKDAKHEES